MDIASSGLKQSTAISFQKPIEPAQNFFGNTDAPKPIASDSVYISHVARQMLSAKTPNELGVDENDWRGHGDVLKDPEKSAKLRDEFFQLMNGDPRIQEIASLLGIEV